MEELKDRLRRAMVARGHTQTLAAGAMGISQTAVSDYLRGRKPHALLSRQAVETYIETALAECGTIQGTD